jgi:hypothetical protein
MMVADLAAQASGLGNMMRWEAGSMVGARSGGRAPTIALLARACSVPAQPGRGVHDGE